VKTLQKAGYSFTTSDVRIEERDKLEAVIDQMKPRYVLCFAGLAGRPNIDWCETHRVETIRANILGQLTVADLCLQRSIHCTLIGTGSLYSYDSHHLTGSGIGFREEEEPNFANNFYVRMRIILEALIKEYPNVLNLRVVFPISDDFHPRSMPAKLTKYPKILSIPTSYSVLDDLWPILIEMPRKNLTGTFNFTNPGVTDHSYILGLYRELIEPNFSWVEVTEEEKESMQKVPRSFSELDVSKLLHHFPNIPSVKESVRFVFERMKRRLELETS